MRHIAVTLASVFGVAVIYACGGVGSTPDNTFGSGGNVPPVSREGTGSGDPIPTGTELPPGENCVCPVGTWKCKGPSGSLSFPITDSPCTVNACTGAFSLNVEGTQVTGTFKSGQLCYSAKGTTLCVTCTKGTVVGGDDGGTSFDSGIKDSSTPKDSGPDVVKSCVPTCETNTDCQTTCPVVQGSIACCDTTSTFSCYSQTGSTCP